MIDEHLLQHIATALPQFTDEKHFSSQVVKILGDRLGFHCVHLFLVDEQRQNALFIAGYGRLAESLLTHGHRLSLSKTGLVADVVNHGEIHLEKPIHPLPFCCGHEHRKCKPPAKAQIDTLLKFQVVREADVRDWRTQSGVVPPIGWEICSPMQSHSRTFGAIDFFVQLNLNDDEKEFWKESLLTEEENGMDFSEDQCSGLQWLVNLISSKYQKAKAL
jgi:hypothetical protein